MQFMISKASVGIKNPAVLLGISQIILLSAKPFFPTDINLPAVLGCHIFQEC